MFRFSFVHCDVGAALCTMMDVHLLEGQSFSEILKSHFNTWTHLQDL